MLKHCLVEEAESDRVGQDVVVVIMLVTVVGSGGGGGDQSSSNLVLVFDTEGSRRVADGPRSCLRHKSRR